MKVPYKIQSQFQEQIDNIISKLLVTTPYNKYKRGIRGYIADVVCGRATYYDKCFTVPFWAFKSDYEKNKETNGCGYFIYYVAHELSHLISHKVYRDICHHDYRFYKIFQEICPKEYQHFELEFRISASKYGIKK